MLTHHCHYYLPSSCKPGALSGVYTDLGGACQSFLPCASPVLAAAASWKGHRLPEVADEGKTFLLVFALGSEAEKPLAYSLQ